MNCLKCYYELDELIKKDCNYCPKCGTPIKNYCPHCNSEKIENDYAYCPDCGKPTFYGENNIFDKFPF